VLASDGWLAASRLFPDVTTPAFELKSSHAADILVVEVAGEVDMATSPQVAQAIEAAPDSCRRVVVDLSELTFLDSSGLNALVVARRSLAARGIDLRVVTPAEHVIRRVFDIAQLGEELGVVDTFEAALV
jgi:anti-anti-sigma factor